LAKQTFARERHQPMLSHVMHVLLAPVGGTQRITWLVVSSAARADAFAARYALPFQCPARDVARKNSGSAELNLCPFPGLQTGASVGGGIGANTG
jgi:hypothetical protein